MTDFRDVVAENRFEQGFMDPDGKLGRVWADYAKQDGRRLVLHVEADPGLRGSGAAGAFMRRLTDHARAERMRLVPVCGYAAAWARRHRDSADVWGNRES